jgi:hypothetical protein
MLAVDSARIEGGRTMLAIAAIAKDLRHNNRHTMLPGILASWIKYYR